MATFETTIKKFAEKGEKTGWTYIDIPSKIADEINPNVKKSYRVKGTINGYEIKQQSLTPMGNGNFILSLNAALRKYINKQVGERIVVALSHDKTTIEPPQDFLDCLGDEPKALIFYQSLSNAQKNYFTHWLNGVKGIEAKTKRITIAINALSNKKEFGQMIREMKGTFNK